MNEEATAVVFGASGLVGSGIEDALRGSRALKHILAPTHKEVDLLDLESITSYFSKMQPDIVIMAAGQVGGILFNVETQHEQFRINFKMNFNLIEACLLSKIDNLYLLSSSCIYPESANIPMFEKDIFNGLPHSTNEGYAIAKSAAVRQVLLYRRIYGLNWKVLVPTNIYGPNDNFNERAHVIPHLILKVSESMKLKNREITVAGDGTPIREFLLNTELGNAVRHLIETNVDFDILNISSGEPVKISSLVEMICEIFKFEGEVFFDHSLPNGHPNKTLDIRLLNEIGWFNQVKLQDGLQNVIESFSRGKNSIGPRLKE